MKLTAFLLIALAAVSSQGLAASQSYQCLITEESHLNSTGVLKPYPKPLALGKRFAVDRNTGSLVEPDLAFWSPSDATVSVLARGNKDNSFVALYVAPAAKDGVHSTLLRVEEFSANSKKPFVVLSNGSVYSGVCE